MVENNSDRATGRALANFPTRNPNWGFYGAIRHCAPPDEAWQIAFDKIVVATGCNADGVRAFLDSRYGRHFADEVGNALKPGVDIVSAVSESIARWMNWPIGRRMSHQTGIPADLPYLVGLVMQHEIEAEYDTSQREQGEGESS